MKQPGQNLIEYSVIIGLVVVVSVGGLVFLGQNLSQSMGDAMGAGQNGGSMNNGGGTGGTRSRATSLPSPFTNLAYDKVTMDLGNGKSINFFAPSLSEVADTAGGNGVTDRAAYIMKQLADELKASGEITEAEYQDLAKLSQIGYSLRDIQRALEQSLPAGGLTSHADREAFRMNTMLNYNGRQEQYMTVASELGTGFLGPNVDMTQALTNNFGADLLSARTYTEPAIMQRPGIAFLQLADKIQNSPSFQNKPVLRDLVINTLSKEIYNSTMMTGQVFDKAAINNTLIPITEQNSGSICNLSNSITCQQSA